MEKFRLPVMIPGDCVPTITQPFGKTANTLEPKGPNGEEHFHYGVDLTFGNPAETFGTPLVCPFENGTLNAYMMPPTEGISTPYMQLEGSGASGNHYKVIFAHISTILFSPHYAEGTIIGTVGNYGMVAPRPSVGMPFAGSHLHLGLIRNGEWVDPLDYFDYHLPFGFEPHNASADLPRIQWALDSIKAQLAKLAAGQ